MPEFLLELLAGKVGLARSSVRQRIARMEAEGIILGYRADVQPGPLGRGGPASSTDGPAKANASAGNRLTHSRLSRPFAGAFP